MSNKKCGRCDTQIGLDEGYYFEGYKRDVCSSCYNEMCDTCQLCGDSDLMPSGVSEFILVKTELADTCDRLPGIYRVTDRPFLSIPMIGTGSMDSSSVLFVDRLPKPDRMYDISGHICKECAAPYDVTCHNAYDKFVPPPEDARNGASDPLMRLRWSREGWEWQRDYTRNVFLCNPICLRDLEMDKNEWDWRSLKKLYQFPDMQPYHEWVYLKHKGVTVYRVYNDGAWLTLRPEPRYRNTHNPLTFDATSLPTYKSPEHYSYHHPEEDRAAVIAAIDEGIITQYGLASKNTKAVRKVELHIPEVARTAQIITDWLKTKKRK